MKNYGELRGCYPTRPLALVDNTLLDLLNSSYPTKAEFITELLIYCNAIKTDTDSHDTDGQTWPHLQCSS